MEFLPTLLICLFCLIMSAYFSATETAFLSFNRIRMKLLAETNKRAKTVLKLDDKTDRVISTILVGNNIVNILLSSLATVMFLKLDQTNGATIATVVTTVVVLIFGEISPKTAAKQASDGFILFSAPILRFLMIVLFPVTIIFQGIQTLLLKCFRAQEEVISEGELKTFVDEAEEDGGITKQEGDLIRSAIDFNARDVEAILTPRVDIAAVEENDSREEIAKVFSETGFSRLPVYSDTIDNILGILNEKDFNNGDGTPIQELITPALNVPPHMRIPDLLRKLQQSKVHIAVVVDLVRPRVAVDFRSVAQVADECRGDELAELRLVLFEMTRLHVDLGTRNHFYLVAYGGVAIRVPRQSVRIGMAVQVRQRIASTEHAFPDMRDSRGHGD